MWSTYLLIFLMLCVGVAGWLIFIWAVKSGQYDDVEGPKYRMLDDEPEDLPPSRRKKPASPASAPPSSGTDGGGPDS